MEYRGFTLDTFQANAIEALQEGMDVLVAAPTGTGKTVVADWIVENTLAAGKQVVFTAPIKALSNQKFRDYRRLFGEEKVGLVTGDLVIRRDAPCRVMTTEILRNILLSEDPPKDLAAVVIDEIHFLDDPDRGTTWEEVLIYLPPTVQIVGLSATLANLDQFASWLSEVRGRDVVVVEEHHRTVPLQTVVATWEEGLLRPVDMDKAWKAWERETRSAREREASKSRGGDRRGGGRGGRNGRGRSGGRRERAQRFCQPTRHFDVFGMLYPDHAPYLYFVFSRKDAEGLARHLVRGLHEPLLNPEQRAEVDARIVAFMEQTGAEAALDDELARMYRHGVAFHHAGLHVMLKALVEELYEAKLIAALYCTSTFALGINMPARAAVFDSMERYNGEEMIPLPAREFMQMAGRAGRRGLDDFGLVVVRTDMDQWEGLRPQLQRYLRGDLEDVHSRFSLSFHSVAQLLNRHPEVRIRRIVESSFLAFLRRNKAEEDSQSAQILAASLEQQGWSEGESHPKGLRKEVRRLHRLRERASTGTDQTWAEFEEKIFFLKVYGYIAEDGEFLAGGKALLHIQFQEIFTVELFLEGLLDQLDMTTLFGVLCGMCNDLPRGVSVPEARSWRDLAHHIQKVRTSDVVMEGERLGNGRVTWDPQMIPLGTAWAEGQPLAAILEDLHSTSDIAGDLVGAFRRARDLLGQVASLWHQTDPERAREAEALSRFVRRDEVEVLD